MLLQVKGLTYYYMPHSPYRQKALDNLDLDIQQGDITGIIGRAGSGKTTLVQHFNGLLRPSRGKVLFRGIDLYGEGPVDWKRIRQQVGLVFQYPEEQLFGETVLEDVAFGPRKLGIPEGEVLSRVEMALEMVGLSYARVKDCSPFQLSRGQMRRVAVSGVLAMEPELLVLDEPTSGLDPRGKKDLLERIKILQREKGITVVFVSHNMEEIACLARQVVVLEKGEIVLQGTPGEVFQEVQQLESLGLELPQVTRLMWELNKRGKNLPTDIFTVEDSRREIVKMIKGAVGPGC